MTRSCSTAVMCALAACGSSNSTPADAKKADAAVAATVTTVDCSSITPTATVTIPNPPDNAYSPMSVTITQGQVVEFMTTLEHDVTPGHEPSDTTIADPGIHVPFNMTGCRMFTTTGTYGFHCSVHGFNGTITVQ